MDYFRHPIIISVRTDVSLFNIFCIFGHCLRDAVDRIIISRKLFSSEVKCLIFSPWRGINGLRFFQTDSWTLKIALWAGLTFPNSSVNKFLVLRNVRAYNKVWFFELLCGFAIISCGGPVNWYLMKTKGNWPFEFLIQTTAFLRLLSDLFV